MHLFARRRVLDQFQKIVLPDHRAFGRGEIFAHLERTLVDLGRHAAIFREVRIEVLQTLQERHAAGIDDALGGSRVSDQRVRGRHCIGDHAHDELGARVLKLVHLEVANPFVEVFLRGEVGLHAALVEGVVFPGRVLEAAILAVRLAVGLAQQDLGVLSRDLAGGLGGGDRVRHCRTQHHGDSAQQFLPVYAPHERVQRRRAFSSIPGNLFLWCRHFRSSRYASVFR